ncbi:DNA polymerase III catalytic subunit, PolC type [Eubacterium ruminantium]|nr:DNA polymerase III catalytic subunit, PolC type [Eubacterium ruminantium]
MERKKFYEVFPDVALEKEYSDIFNHVNVVKIVNDFSKERFDVYFEADRLIEKKDIYRAEEVLKEHLFTSKGKTKVRFIERYLLSGQYNPKTLLDSYKESFLCEIKKKSEFDYQIMKKADFVVEENVISVTIEDNFVSRGRVPEIKEYLEKTYLNRFGMSVEVLFYFKDSENGKKLSNGNKAGNGTNKKGLDEIFGEKGIRPADNGDGRTGGQSGGAETSQNGDLPDRDDDKTARNSNVNDQGSNDITGRTGSGEADRNDAGESWFDEDSWLAIEPETDEFAFVVGDGMPYIPYGGYTGKDDKNSDADTSVYDGDRYDGASGTAGEADGEQPGVYDDQSFAMYEFAAAASSEYEPEEKSKGKTEDNDKTAGKASGKTPEKDAKDDKKEKKIGTGREYSKGGGSWKSRSNDPECFYGRNCEGDTIPISQLEDNMGEVCIHGQVLAMEERELRSGKILITATITDFTDTIAFKLFVSPDDIDVMREELSAGKFYKIKGVPAYDAYAKEVNITSITGVKHSGDWRVSRSDDEEEKRIELNMHTVMSEMDSVVDIKKMIKRAKEWGHKAIAITDNGAVQGFPIANHEITMEEEFKVIYGVTGYLANDLKTLVLNGHDEDFDRDDTEFVVFDIETTGLSVKHCKIIEIGAVRIDKNGKELGRFSEFVNPEVPIPYNIEKLTSITDSMVAGAPTIEVILPQFLEFSKGAVLVAHNAAFDTGFIREYSFRLGYSYDFTALDTMTLAQVFIPEIGRYNLDRLCKYFNVVNQHHHRACDDADVTGKIFVKMMELIRSKGISTVKELNDYGSVSADKIKKGRVYDSTILVRNNTGRVNLYRLISESHINYFNIKPRIPMSLLEEYREGLLVGSGTSGSELYEYLLNGASDEEIASLVKFFDYLEVQPPSNDEFMINDDRSRVTCREDLEDIVRKIIELGEEYGKPVVATGNVHFLDPDDAIYREIVIEGNMNKGSMKKVLKEAAENGESTEQELPPLYFRTTREMLDEFSFLGFDKAKEIVIENTNKINDMIEKISPVRPDKAPPVIENSDKTLREICYNKAHEIYGPNLPEIVETRLEKELNSIIGNGYSVMYIIAQKLVWKSNDDGYLVGSRGSVGSSFAATMAGITEVNPLSPHYICPNCFYTDFDSELVKSYSGMSGCDMPDCDCPKCGTKMKKEGHDIPFETFLGFKGDKEPDIDLNFSGDYQPRAHAYIEEIFGKGKAFRAGTIGTLAEKTAYGYVLKYCEARGITKRRAEIERLAAGCTGVKRTTGQHPGGIIVLPAHEEIYTFTPIQRPANDMTTDITTTHFEYHSIDHNLLKFDILGHDDPTMIRRLEDLTGTDAKKVPLDDKKVMALFHGTSSLGITPEDIGGTPLGCLGIPEFGTDFAMQMVIDAKPESFSDLVRISGLSHGTDVWLGNAQTLIEEGKCKLSSAICCRDDIMVYLIHMGLESGTAFSIMENVRKGKVAGGKCKDWAKWKEDMAAHNIPDWYIWSCEKIKYMFPKAHAAAYVMMAWRIAYYKIYYPQAYYAAFFSIRADAFSYEQMCCGREKLDRCLAELRKIDKKDQTAKDADSIKDMRIVQEMYARGFEFMPIDIYKADDKYFQVIDGKIMPSLASIDGMGEKAAAQLKAAAKDGIFLSQEELRDRAKLSKTVVEKMAELGILGDMPEQGQLSFDFL